MARRRRLGRTGRREASLHAVRAVWVRRERPSLLSFWTDKERRRALLLSALLHAAALLGVMWLYLVPESTPEKLVVLELTPPPGGAAERAAAADEAAPPGSAQVAGNASADATGTPSSAPPDAAADTTASETVPPAQTAQAEPLPPSERPPDARLPAQTAAPPPDLPVQAPASTLPEIEAVEVAPQPLEDAIALPAPDPEVVLTPPRRLAVTPQVAVTEARTVPTPAAAATVVSRDVALPQVQAAVTAEDAVPQPEVAATVAEAETVPRPDVQPEVARAVPAPQVGATVAAPQALPQPEAAAVVASRTVPEPQAGAVVSAPRAVPQPAVSGSASAGERVPVPEAGAVVSQAQPLAVTPGVVVSEGVGVVTPPASAVVTPLEQGEATAGTGSETAADAGDGPRSAQADAASGAAGQGAAADGGSGADAGVTDVQSFEVTLEQPLAVLIDNADDAYPQQGLVEADSVYEMPVEGGMTRLMSVYTKGDPAQVGPIRSARDYFLEAALALNGTLVHVGGEPSSVSRIASQNLPTLDALQQGALFAQAPDRSAPHSTFSTGTALRDAVGRLESQVNGTLYLPPADAADVSQLTVGYSADYTSGFRYLPELDRYRWVRSGADAADAAGTAVTADAVVVAQVLALPKSGDPEGRLYLPYSGGAATLYLRGKAVPGTWTPEGGFSFLTETGVKVDLTPFKRWLLFAPEGAQVTAQ